MNELIQAALKGALTTAEKIVENLKSLDEFVHETVDGAIHRTIEYWEAVAARIRSELGIVAASGDREFADSVCASAASFVDEVKAGAA